MKHAMLMRATCLYTEGCCFDSHSVPVCAGLYSDMMQSLLGPLQQETVAAGSADVRSMCQKILCNGQRLGPEQESQISLALTACFLKEAWISQAGVEADRIRDFNASGRNWIPCTD